MGADRDEVEANARIGAALARIGWTFLSTFAERNEERVRLWHLGFTFVLDGQTKQVEVALYYRAGVLCAASPIVLSTASDAARLQIHELLAETMALVRLTRDSDPNAHVAWLRAEAFVDTEVVADFTTLASALVSCTAGAAQVLIRVLPTEVDTTHSDYVPIFSVQRDPGAPSRGPASTQPLVPIATNARGAVETTVRDDEPANATKVA